jgi:hypothetical protein
VPEEALEHGVDPACRAEDALEPRPAAARPEDDEVAHGGLARALAVDDHRHAALEVRLGDEELALAGELAHEKLAQAASIRT